MKDITLEEAHKLVADIYPLYENPKLDTTKECREMLIHCGCGAGYRVIANGIHPIAPIPESIKCKNCGQLAKDQTISGHSAGVFNATIRRI